MASESANENELLASDNEMASASTSAIPPAQPSFSTSSATLNDSNTQQIFQQFAQFLDTKLDQKLASFKRSFDEKDEQHASQLKKLKTASKASSSFKFKGNKIEFEFNVALTDGLETIHKQILDGNLTQAIAESGKLKAFIEKRNKLIRFADKSPAGWTAVDEYQSDELAEDSEDEKRLRAAERRALAKIKMEKQAKKSNFSARREIHQQQPNSLLPPAQSFRPFQPFRQPFRGGRYPQPSDKCFACGQRGHWAGSPACNSSRRFENRQYSTSSTAAINWTKT